jgi:hypothetical protein
MLFKAAQVGLLVLGVSFPSYMIFGNQHSIKQHPIYISATKIALQHPQILAEYGNKAKTSFYVFENKEKELMFVKAKIIGNKKLKRDMVVIGEQIQFKNLLIANSIKKSVMEKEGNIEENLSKCEEYYPIYFQNYFIPNQTKLSGEIKPDDYLWAIKEIRINGLNIVQHPTKQQIMESTLKFSTYEELEEIQKEWLQHFIDIERPLFVINKADYINDMLISRLSYLKKIGISLGVLAVAYFLTHRNINKTKILKAVENLIESHPTEHEKLGAGYFMLGTRLIQLYPYCFVLCNVAGKLAKGNVICMCKCKNSKWEVKKSSIELSPWKYRI